MLQKKILHQLFSLSYSLGFFLFFVCVFNLNAQIKIICNSNLSGKITGFNNKLPLAGVYIHLLESNIHAISDENGKFQFKNVCNGNFTISFQLIGFKSIYHKSIIKDSLFILVNLLEQEQELKEVEVKAKKIISPEIIQIQSELSGKELESTRGLSLGESLKNLSGLYSIQTGPSISKPVIHGLHSNRILILNNGVRQEGQQWGSEHAPEIDAFMATRISVIKGPASIRYGSDAIGGVIMIEPKSMPQKLGFGGELNLIGMSNNRMGVSSGILEGALNKRLLGLSWRLQGTIKKAGYTKAPGYYLENTSFQENNFSGNLNYIYRKVGIELFYSQFNTKLGLLTASHAESLKDFYAAIARPEPLSQPSFSYALERPYQKVQHDLFKSKAYINLGSGKITAIFARQKNQRSEYDYVPFSGTLNPEFYLKLISHTLDLIYEHPYKKGFSGSIGMNGITQGNKRLFQFLIPDFRSYGGGIFAIEKYAKNQWEFEAGVRYDVRFLKAYFLNEQTNIVSSKVHTWNNITGSLAASYQVNNNLELSANLATAWRAPTVSELYSNGLHQSAVAYEKGNENLLPEQAYNFNFSIDYSGPKLSAELGFYNNNISNYIYIKPDSVPIVRQRGAFPSYSYSQDNAVFRGIDATISYKLTTHLSFTNKTSLLFAFNKTKNDYLVYITPNRTDNAIKYELKKAGKLFDLFLSINTLYVARQNRAPAVTKIEDNGKIIFTGDFAPVPSDYLLLGSEAGFSFRLKSQIINLIVTGNNLLDHSYRDYLNRFRYFSDEAGRNISVKIKIPFQILHSDNNF